LAGFLANLAQVQTVCGEEGKVGKCLINAHKKASLHCSLHHYRQVHLLMNRTIDVVDARRRERPNFEGAASN
jgi:hypothetical protein